MEAKVGVGGWGQGSGSPGMRMGTKADALNAVPGSLVFSSWTVSRGCHAVWPKKGGLVGETTIENLITKMHNMPNLKL